MEIPRLFRLWIAGLLVPDNLPQDALIGPQPVRNRRDLPPWGSAAIRTCPIARGEAGGYFEFAERRRRWKIADSAHAVQLYIGGSVSTLHFFCAGENDLPSFHFRNRENSEPSRFFLPNLEDVYPNAVVDHAGSICYACFLERSRLP
jgi:hypothetical protein